MTLEQISGVEEEYEVRRSHSSLDQVVYFESMLIVPRHLLQLLEFLQPIIQQTRRNTCIPLIIRVDYFLQQFGHTKGHFSTDEHKRIAMQLAQMFLQLLVEIVLGLVSIGLLDYLPFVDCNHHWPPLLYHRLYQIVVIDHHRRIRIHYIHNDMALLHVRHRTDLNFAEVFLLCSVQIRSVDTCCVDELDLSLLVL